MRKEEVWTPGGGGCPTVSCGRLSNQEQFFINTVLKYEKKKNLSDETHTQTFRNYRRSTSFFEKLYSKRTMHETVEHDRIPENCGRLLCYLNV